MSAVVKSRRAIVAWPPAGEAGEVPGWVLVHDANQMVDAVIVQDSEAALGIGQIDRADGCAGQLGGDAVEYGEDIGGGVDLGGIGGVNKVAHNLSTQVSSSRA